MFQEVALSLPELNVESRAEKTKALKLDECMFGMNTFLCYKGKCTCK